MFVRSMKIFVIYATKLHAIVQILTRIYADCSTYEPTEQFNVKRQTTQQTFSHHFFFYIFSETTTQSHLD